MTKWLLIILPLAANSCCTIQPYIGASNQYGRDIQGGVVLQCGEEDSNAS